MKNDLIKPTVSHLPMTMTELLPLRLEIKCLIDSSQGIMSSADLMEIRENLDAIAFTLQESESGYYASLLKGEEAVKKFERSLIDREVSLGMAFNRAELKAKLETGDLRDTVIELRSSHKDIEGLKFTLKSYIEGLRQRIAGVKSEEAASRERERMNP